jgi:hypothetical protein
MGGRPLRLPGAGGKRGGAHGVVAREEGEAELSRRDEEEEGRMAAWPRGPRSQMGWLAAWAGRPNGLAGHWAEWAESEGKFFSE